jgi:hypothetical protein
MTREGPWLALVTVALLPVHRGHAQTGIRATESGSYLVNELVYVISSPIA